MSLYGVLFSIKLLLSFLTLIIFIVVLCPLLLAPLNIDQSSSVRGCETGNDPYASYAGETEYLKLAIVNIQQVEGVVVHWVDFISRYCLFYFCGLQSSLSSRPSRLPSAFP